MEIGICTTPQIAAGLPAGAFDFVEANVPQFLMPEGSEADFENSLKAARGAEKPVKTANGFLPGQLKCVGPDVDRERLSRYVETTFHRAEKAGIETIVFGSGAARAVPDGFSKADAIEQITSLLAAMSLVAQQHGVTLVIEPLNRRECNFINSLAEGAALVSCVDHPQIRLLADCYHMRVENEPESEVVRFGKWIKHVHVAELAGRSWPGHVKENFTVFFNALRQAHYTGPISIEASWEDLARDLESSAKYLRGQLSEAGF